VKYLFASLVLLVGVTGDAATPLPPELTGIWATSGSQFHGDAVWKGHAIYLDSDGVGAIVGGDGSDVLGVRITVTSYDATSHFIGFDLTENGKVLDHGTLTFHKQDHALVSSQDSQRYYRRASLVSAAIRKSIGLEPRP
jgi:hypothetical protein